MSWSGAAEGVSSSANSTLASVMSPFLAISAVSRARSRGLERMMAGRTLRACRPRTTSLVRSTPSAVSGRSPSEPFHSSLFAASPCLRKTSSMRLRWGQISNLSPSITKPERDVTKGTDFKSVPPAQKSLDGHRSYVYYVDLLYKLDKLHALFEEK